MRFGTDLALVIIDLDDFKLINDTAGHRTGDQVLAHFGRIMGETCRDFDVAARIGGDEFAYILPGSNHMGAEVAMTRLAHNLETAPRRPMLPQGLGIELSYGVAQIREGITSPEQLDALLPQNVDPRALLGN